MSVVTYTAVDRGRLVSGHSELTEYSFEMPVSSVSMSAQNQGTVQKSLSGKRFHTLHNIERSTSLTTILIHRIQESDVIDQIEEFLSSVAAGETFQIDLYGSLAFPGNVSTYAVDGPHSTEIVDSVYLQYSFNVVEI